MPASFIPAPGLLFSTSFGPSAGPVKLYLDESGTLGYAGEVFTMAIVLVRDLPRLETSIAKHKVTQSESKASQMRTQQKLALARTLIEENDLHIFLADLDGRAAMASERKLDKDLLYDSMAGQALAYYLQRGDLQQGLSYRLSMDIRGSLRESYEDMVRGSIGNVLMHREQPLVSDLDVRFLDSKFSAGVQAADLFSNVYRTALSQKDSPCQGFLRQYVDKGVVSAGFTFGLPQLADQMTQIASDLRALVELEGELDRGSARLGLGVSMACSSAVREDSTDLWRADSDADVTDEEATGEDAERLEGGEATGEPGRGTSRSARRRRSRNRRGERREEARDDEARAEDSELDNEADAPTGSHRFRETREEELEAARDIRAGERAAEIAEAEEPLSELANDGLDAADEPERGETDDRAEAEDRAETARPGSGRRRRSRRVSRRSGSDREANREAGEAEKTREADERPAKVTPASDEPASDSPADESRPEGDARENEADKRPVRDVHPGRSLRAQQARERTRTRRSRAAEPATAAEFEDEAGAAKVEPEADATDAEPTRETARESAREEEAQPKRPASNRRRRSRRKAEFVEQASEEVGTPATASDSAEGAHDAQGTEDVAGRAGAEGTPDLPSTPEAGDRPAAEGVSDSGTSAAAESDHEGTSENTPETQVTAPAKPKRTRTRRSRAVKKDEASQQSEVGQHAEGDRNAEAGRQAADEASDASASPATDGDAPTIVSPSAMDAGSAPSTQDDPSGAAVASPREANPTEAGDSAVATPAPKPRRTRTRRTSTRKSKVVPANDNLTGDGPVDESPARDSPAQADVPVIPDAGITHDVLSSAPAVPSGQVPESLDDATPSVEA